MTKNSLSEGMTVTPKNENAEKKALWLTGGYVEEPTFQVGSLLANVEEANEDEDFRIGVVTSVAALSRGKDKSNNPTKRYQRLLNEAVNNPEVIDKEYIQKTAGRPLEFVPVILYVYLRGGIYYLVDSKNIKDVVKLFMIGDPKALDYVIKAMKPEEFNNTLGRYGYLKDTDITVDVFKFYTNLRACINAGIPYEKIPYGSTIETDKDYANFVCFKINAPHFVFDQVYTHTAFSKLAVSERVTSEDDYYLPDDIIDRIYKHYKESTDEDLQNDGITTYIGKTLNKKLQDKNEDIPTDIKKDLILELVTIFLSELTHDEVVAYLEDLNYPKEIVNRWSYGLKFKTFFMAGWRNDPNAWNHFLVEREAYPELYKSWVQKETAKIAKAIRKLLTCVDE